MQLILIIFVIYFLILVFLYFYQRNLLYHPNENNYSEDKISVEIKKVKIPTSDNIELVGWYHEKNLKSYKTLIYFHGNAGSLENRIHNKHYMYTFAKKKSFQSVYTKYKYIIISSNSKYILVLTVY